MDFSDEGKADQLAASPVEFPPIGGGEEPAVAKQDKDYNMRRILDLPVDVHVELGQSRMTIQNIVNFGIGTILELDRVAGDPVDIVVNGKYVGKGEVVVVDENYGIRVTDLVDPEKRIQAL
ncbi:MAG: flagellar motor switch protein FliN [Lentisphaerae bacterium]|nr:flagellar motor switch protein FliN [Lentisphaerota bacterium]